MPLPRGMCLQCGGAKALGNTGVWGGGGCWKVVGRGAGKVLGGGRDCLKGARKVLEGVPAVEGSVGRVQWKRVQAPEGGFQQCSKQGFRHRKGFWQGFQQGFQEVLYHLYHLHSVLFHAAADVWPQLVHRDESVAEPQARGASAASVVGTLSVTWQGRDMLTWPTSARAKPGAVVDLMFPSSQTPWYEVL